MNRIKGLLSPRVILFCMVLFQVLVHLPVISSPPLGQHTWRQVVGHATAKNYFEEDMSFFSPRADIRFSDADTGAIYHELPITYWLTAQSYKIFGINPISQRVISLLFNLILIFGSYYLALGLSYSRKTALLFAYMMTCSPLYIYYANTFVPNILGLSLFLAGLAFYLKASKNGKGLVLWALATTLLASGTLAKPTYLFYGLSILAILLARVYEFRKSKSLWRPLVLRSLVMGSLILLANALVLNHAKRLYDASPKYRAMHTPMGPAELADGWQSIWQNLDTGVGQWFIEMNVGHGALLFFLIGLYQILRQKTSPQSLTKYFWWSWMASLTVFSSLFIMRFRDHDYYLTSSLPLAAICSAIGASWMLDQKKWRKMAMIFLFLTPVFGFWRIQGRWFKDKQVPEVFLSGKSDEIVRMIPKKDLVIVVGDRSPIVFLYYLNRKGFSIDATLVDGNHTLPDLQDFKWVISYDQSGGINPKITEALTLNLVQQIHGFSVFKVTDHHQTEIAPDTHP